MSKEEEGLERIKQVLVSKYSEEIVTRPIMTNHSFHLSRLEREVKCQFFFEELNCPYYQSVQSSLLQFYASGKTSGILIGLGHDQTYSIPIIDG